MKTLFFSSLCCLYLGSSALLYAQSNPKQFFKKDFAAESGSKEEPSSTPQASATKSAPKPDTDGLLSEQPILDSSEGVNETDETIITPSPEEQTQKEPIPVHSIGAILNSQDKEHFLSCMKELTDVAIDTDRMIATVYTIGDMRNVEAAKDYVFKIVGRGGELKVRDELPKKYIKVSMSPTWILKTEKGEIVLEATGPLAANFNAKGEFVDKNRRNQLVLERSPIEMSGISDSGH